MFVVAVEPAGAWPRIGVIVVAVVTCQIAVISCGGAERTVALTRTSTFGIVYVPSPRNVVCHGSTLLQPRGSGPASAVPLVPAYFCTDAQVLTTPRPVLAPTDAVSPPRN